MSDAPSTLPPGQISESGGVAGVAGFQTAGSDYNAIDMMVRQILANQGQTMLVTVKAVHGGGAGTPCTVDVRPMVNQVDGLGKQTPHDVVSGLPVFRYQAGAAAVILDPVAGDIGLAIVCGRDISIVKQTGKISGPGSFRQNSWSDGCYLGGFANGAATRYIIATSDGWEIVGNVSIIGTLMNNGVNVSSTHVHNAPSGGGDTSPPL